MPSDAAPTALQRVTELRVSGHLMTLETGLFCILNQPAPSSAVPAAASGLPGVRISLPPGADPRNPRVFVSGFREDGWLSSAGDAALVRVSNGPAQILVTIYQGQDTAVPAPNLQVMRLSEAVPAEQPAPPPPKPQPVPPPTPAAAPAQAPAPARVAPPPAAAPANPPAAAGPREISAHVQRRGDVFVAVGDWIGDRKSQRWIEGFAIAPQNGIALEDLEYQAVLGRGWLSPWVEGGQFCGSRGMALPILGLRVRLRGTAAEMFDCSLSATFVDGTAIGPVANGDPCEADSLAPLEAFQLILRPRPAQRQGIPVAPRQAAPPQPAAKPKAVPKPKPKPKAKTPAKPAGRGAPAGRRR